MSKKNLLKRHQTELEVQAQISQLKRKVVVFLPSPSCGGEGNNQVSNVLSVKRLGGRKGNIRLLLLDYYRAVANSKRVLRVGLVRPTFESELRPTFGSEVRQTPLMLLRSKLFLLSPAPHPI